MSLRHQLAVYSPIPVRALAAAAAGAFGLNADAPEQLSELLRREYFADDVLLCGSGTQALQIAIEIARRETGDDAIVGLPAFSCFDVASAAIGAGGPVVLYDLDPSSLSPDLDSLGRSFASGVKIVVVAPLYGIPVDWDAIKRLASASGALIIEDAAQGHGATYASKPLGALGAISTLSFGRGKGWTGGSGGAVMVRRLNRRVTWPSLVAAPAVDLGTMLRLDAQFFLGRPALYGLPRRLPGLDLGETVYHPPVRPAGLSRAAASAVLATRAASLGEADHRRAAVQHFQAQVRESDRFREIKSAAGPRGLCGFLRFPVLAQGGLLGFANPDAAETLGVAASYPRRLFDLPQLAAVLTGGDDLYPGAARLVAQLITFPVHSRMSAGDRASLSRLVGEYRGDRTHREFGGGP